jgi:hypothetical protein
MLAAMASAGAAVVPRRRACCGAPSVVAVASSTATMMPMAGFSRWVGGVLALGGFVLTFASCWQGDPASERCELGVTPPCGQMCRGKCGCHRMDYSSCAPDGILVGRGECYDFTPCSGPDRCVMGSQGASCAESNADCGDVHVAYETGLGYSLTVRSGAPALAIGPKRDIHCPEACTVLQGHCAQGLDTCWLLPKYFAGPETELDRLADLYQSLGCPSLGRCECPPSPLTSCQFDASLAKGMYRGPLTCMVN